MKNLVIVTLFVVNVSGYAMWKFPDPFVQLKLQQQSRSGMYDPDANLLFNMGLKAIELSFDPRSLIKESSLFITPEKLRTIGIKLIKRAAIKFQNSKAYCALWYFDRFNILSLHGTTKKIAKSYPLLISAGPTTDLLMGLIELSEKITHYTKQPETISKISTTEEPDIDYSKSIKTLINAYKSIDPEKKRTKK